MLLDVLANGQKKQYRDILAEARKKWESEHGKIPEDKPFKIGRTLAVLAADGKVARAGKGHWRLSKKQASKPKEV